MEKLQKALDYFIEYEWAERLHNITLNEKQHINITREETKDISSLRNRLFCKKKEQITNVIDNIKFKDIQRKKQIVFELNAVWNNLNGDNFNVEDILHKEDYQYEENYLCDVAKIQRILQDNQIMILFPILASGKRKIPLICFEVELTEKALCVQTYHLQMEALRIIIAAIQGCEIPEVEVCTADFEEFYQTLTTLENPNLFEIIDIINEELKGKFVDWDFESIWTYKNFNQWAVTEEIILTMEAFDEVMFPPFQEELKEVRHQCQEKNSPILQKYLFGSNRREESQKVPVEFYNGSYQAEFAINEKQYKVISAYQNSQLLSVNGPPGTGKTTVLKELIADNIVKKTKKLLENWEKPWNPIGTGNQKVYLSPFDGNCEYSMIIASANNKAVDNIGEDLLKEIDYFSEVIYENEKGYRGILCARLGNRNNMLEFRNIILNPLIAFLEDAKYNAIEASACMQDFQQVKKELDEYKRINSEYLLFREQILESLKKFNLLTEPFQEESIQNALVEVNENIAEIARLKQEGAEQQRKFAELRDAKSKDIIEIDARLEMLKCSLKEKQCQIQEIQAKSQYVLVGRLLTWLAERKFGTQDNIQEEIKQITNDITFISSVKEQSMKDYTKAVESYSQQENIIEECKKKETEEKEKKQLLEKWDELKEKFQMLKQKYSCDLYWNDSPCRFNTCIEITTRRSKMFLLSLKLTQWYIKRHAQEIKYNLEKVYPDKWFQPFYRRDFHYDNNYTKYLKAVWESVFLCFPVVTTTFSAFERKKFPMIQEMFDTLLIDEAGQASIHIAVGPLFRFRKAVIVGDVFQLEPIRNAKGSCLIDKVNLSIQEKENIDIEKNSIQHAADRGSEIFDKLNQQEVGIVLEEHRRCENSIVQFSNQYVYDKHLKIIKEDVRKAFLDSNFCMLDIRGKKTKRNENISEVEVCVKVIEKLLEIYGDEYKKKIGIITPYRNQADLLKQRLPDIDSGTVHVFQGQEKEVILMSLVVDNSQKNSGTFFVGNKPNFLNVAFTRAKKQLILVGNYEACDTAKNYLSYAMECLLKYGKLYSLYEPEIMRDQAIDEKYLSQFWNIMSNNAVADSKYEGVVRKYATKGMIAGPQNHHGFFKDILTCMPKTVKVVSPWIRANVVDSDFLLHVKRLKEQNRVVKICFGFNKTNFTLNQIDKIVERDNFGKGVVFDEKAIEELKNILKDDLRYQSPLHSKILIIDDEFMVVGSHNWLSNRGEHASAKDEMGCLVYDKSAIEFVNSRYQLNN